VLNEIVWRNFSTDAWVTFKVFGIMPLTFAFTLLQLPLLNRTQIKADEIGSQ
jgi:intracellular septation protein